MYDLRPGTLEAFLELFPRIVEARREAGFEVVAAWTEHAVDRFVWIVAHDGDFEAAEAAYYAAPRRAELSPSPGELITTVRTWMLDPIEGCSPTGGGE